MFFSAPSPPRASTARVTTARASARSGVDAAWRTGTRSAAARHTRSGIIAALYGAAGGLDAAMQRAASQVQRDVQPIGKILSRPSAGRGITCTPTSSPTRRAAAAPASVAAFTEATSPRTIAVTSPASTFCQPTNTTFAALTMASAASTMPTRPRVSTIPSASPDQSFDIGTAILLRAGHGAGEPGLRDPPAGGHLERSEHLEAVDLPRAIDKVGDRA